MTRLLSHKESLCFCCPPLNLVGDVARGRTERHSALESTVVRAVVVRVVVLVASSDSRVVDRRSGGVSSPQLNTLHVEASGRGEANGGESDEKTGDTHND